MLNITKTIEQGKVTIFLDGRLDTSTSPDLEKEIKDKLDGVSELIFDFDKLQYISSSGLRVLLVAQKTMLKQGEMRIINVSEEVRDILDITGFSDIMNVE